MGEGTITGIGGVFVRSSNPEALASWYREHLGFVVTTAGNPDPEGNYVWLQQAGATVFSIFPADSDYFATERQIMLNLRVDGLAALLARLEGAGILVSHREAMEGVGQFARIHDADGNPLELWEPG